MRKTRHARAFGFTLIELLVVIAIIALLVSILLPSLNRAKVIAKSAICKSNLKNVATWGVMYTAEWNGVLPSNGPDLDEDNTNSEYGTISKLHWQWKAPFYQPNNARGDYPDDPRAYAYPSAGGNNCITGGHVTLLHCPQAQTAIPVRGYDTITLDYSLNSRLGGYKRLNDDSYPKPGDLNTSLLNSSRFWFGDTRLNSLFDGRDPDGSWRTHDHMPCEVDDLLGLPWMWLDYGQGLAGRGHPGDEANFAFGDGHVESLGFNTVDGWTESQQRAFTGQDMAD
jgi:prepilin-type N-terminal cleavage/methylation domain-containing protein/prepilin-type processing-associated H-X9-DG protein